MRTKARSELTQKSIEGLSFLKRFRYKLKDIVKPTMDPKIVLFSRLEKQVLFYVILFFVVAVSIYIVLEFGYFEFI